MNNKYLLCEAQLKSKTLDQHVIDLIDDEVNSVLDQTTYKYHKLKPNHSDYVKVTLKSKLRDLHISIVELADIGQALDKIYNKTKSKNFSIRYSNNMTVQDLINQYSKIYP